MMSFEDFAQYDVVSLPVMNYKDEIVGTVERMVICDPFQFEDEWFTALEDFEIITIDELSTLISIAEEYEER